MGSLAGLFREAGYNVYGSDAAAYPPMNERLAALNISVIEGFSEQNLSPRPDLIIVGNACTPRHPEAAFARDNNFVQASFPEALAKYFIHNRHSIVVAGTHGKTTTTSLLTHVFKTAGFNPGFLIGGIMHDGGSSYSVGSDNYFLVEGDEYDSAYFDKRPKFMHYRPDSAIITSVEFDHADIYRDHAEYLQAFREFSASIPPDGFLAISATEPASEELISCASCNVQLYGIDGGDLMATNVVSLPSGQQFEVLLHGQTIGEFELSMSGRHNLENALAVIAIAHNEKLDMAGVAKGLRTFSGVERRQQVLGEVNGIIVIDDFAHHPTAVGATIQSIQERFPDRRIAAIFEPRSNSSRRKVFEDGYAQALSPADAVFLSSPPFRHNDDVQDFMDIDTVTGRLTDSGVHCCVAETAEDLLGPILDYLKPGDVALVMSNGGFGGIQKKILNHISALQIGDKPIEPD